MLIGMAEFWAFMGKEKGFHCRASLKRFPRDWDKTKNGDSIFTRFGPVTTRSRALKSRGIWVYHEAVWLPRKSEQTFGTSTSCKPSENQIVHRAQSLPMRREILIRPNTFRTSTRPCPHILISTRAQIGDLRPPVLFIGRYTLILQCPNDQPVHQSSVQRL